MGLSVARFLDPMVALLAVLAACLVVAFRHATLAGPWARRALAAAWLTWATLWVIATPAASGWIEETLETRGPDLGEALAGRDLAKTAMVVLAGGLRTSDPGVPLGERLNAATTQRVLTAGRAWREHGVGLVIITGASPNDTASMAAMLATLGVPEAIVLQESRSRDTRENALHSAEILAARGIDTAVVVTSAVHLRRATRAFSRAGVHVIPAAAEIRGMGPIAVDALLPSSAGIQRAHASIHELLGLLGG